MIRAYNLKNIPTDILNEIILIDKKEMNFAWSEKSWKDSIQDNLDFLCLVSFFESKQEVIGFCLFSLNKYDHSVHLLKIAINSLYQRQGVGLALLDYGISELRALGFCSIFLEVESQNTQAISLYTRSHFVRINVIRSFYSNGSNADVMQLVIKS